jgi:hypothetical protein
VHSSSATASPRTATVAISGPSQSTTAHNPHLSIIAPHGDGTQLTLGGVVRHAEAAVVEEARERSPAFEAVVDGLASLAVFGDSGALLAQPGLQRDDERHASLIANTHAFLWRHAVDLALDGEQDIDALGGLGRDWRLVDARQIEELAPPMRPAGGLDHWPRLTVSLIEPIEPGIGVGLHQSGIAR